MELGDTNAAPSTRRGKRGARPGSVESVGSNIGRGRGRATHTTVADPGQYSIKSHKDCLLKRLYRLVSSR